MKEEILEAIRKDVDNALINVKNNNKELKRIKELEKLDVVKEYLKLRSISACDFKYNKSTKDDLIKKLYGKYIRLIDKEETNGIYIYTGTYIDEHTSSDILVSYNDKNADYRSYVDLEEYYGFTVPIKECEEFEKNHLIINPKHILYPYEIKKIRDEFFIKAVRTNQRAAKNMVLRKYKK